MGRANLTNRPPEALFDINCFRTTRLMHDHRAWIVETRPATMAGRARNDGYRVVGIVQSNKEILTDLTRRAGRPVCLVGRRMLAALDDDFWSFHNDLIWLGREQKLIAIQQAAIRVSPRPKRQAEQERLCQQCMELWCQEHPAQPSKSTTGKE